MSPSVFEKVTIPLTISQAPAIPSYLLALSAENKENLGKIVKDYQSFLLTQPELTINDLCCTANLERPHFSQRIAFCVESIEDLQAQLDYLVNEPDDQEEELYCPEPIKASSSLPHQSKIAFLFTGQASQYLGMGWELFQTQHTFRSALQQCDEILQTHMGWSLLSLLYPESPVLNSFKPREQLESLLDQTAYAQPALFSIEYALAQMWKSWGVEPDVVMGHSAGEYVAACIAGVFSLEDGLRLVAHRGRLMQELPQTGSMVVVFASPKDVIASLKGYESAVTVAAVNGPDNTVISGVTDQLALVVRQLEIAGFKTHQLTVSNGFHSPLMEPIIPSFLDIAANVRYQQPLMPYVSNLTGELAGIDMITSDYWGKHIRQPVQFYDGMKALERQGCRLFIEMGPRPTLLGMGRNCLPNLSGLWLTSLSPKWNNWHTITQTLGHLYTNGVTLNWDAMYHDHDYYKVALPQHSF